MRAANGIRECDGRSVVNCVPDFGRSFISYTSGGFRASRPGSDNQLLDRDIRKADLHPSTGPCPLTTRFRSEEHTSELQSLMRSSYAVFCLKKKKQKTRKEVTTT